MMRRAPAGFTMIELMITVTLLGVLAVMAVPMYGAFVANTQIRTATESMLAGLRLAQTEAVRRNGTVEFVLDEATGWQVNVVDPGPVVTNVTGVDFKAGAPSANVQPVGVPRRVTFNGLGRIRATNLFDNSAPLTEVNVSSKNYSGARALRLVVGLPGSTTGIKVCDPALAATDPAGCP
jgi:type IV fimbrial biogenesis protein FimT